MYIKFGASIGAKTPQELTNRLKTALSFSNEAAELGFTSLHEIYFNTEIASLFKQFKYRSIHLPVVHHSENKLHFLRYPSAILEDGLIQIDAMIKECNPHTVLIHPDQIDDFFWLTKRYGNVLAFENMDSKKTFGKTIEDMDEVFNKCPSARWVFDLNHIFTNDKTMKLANDFYNAFSDRLVHYHISGYGGFHDALCITKEDVIVKGLLSIDYPIIDEGDIVHRGLLEKEYDYIRQNIQSSNV